VIRPQATIERTLTRTRIRGSSTPTAEPYGEQKILSLAPTCDTELQVDERSVVS
jgi:hypothetical protein